VARHPDIGVQVHGVTCWLDSFSLPSERKLEKGAGAASQQLFYRLTRKADSKCSSRNP
jgi:hypothetical protein